jgi:cobaltochelatase CobS
LFSEIHGWDPQVELGLKDFYVDSIYQNSYSSHLDPFFVSDEVVWEEDRANTYQAVLALVSGENLLMLGPPGAGKSDFARYLAWLYKIPFIRVNFRDGIEAADILGHVAPMADKSLGFAEGIVPFAWRWGPMLILDEIMYAPAGFMGTLQAALERGGKLGLFDNHFASVEDRYISRAPTLKVVATSNVSGMGENAHMYAAGQVVDTSFLNRWGVTIKANYLPAEKEVELLGKKGFDGINKDIRLRLVKVAKLSREYWSEGKLPLPMTPRDLLTICGLAVLMGELKAAYRISYVNKFGEDEQRALADNAFIKIFSDGVIYV